MKTTRLLIITFLMFCVGMSAFGQFTQPVGEPNASEIGVDSAQQNLKEVSVTKFEDAGFWYSSMSTDQGIAILRRLPGGPLDKEPIPGEVEVGIEEADKYVLGMKIQYFKRGMNTFALFPVRPLPVEGITKTLSLWVVGRNVNNILKVVIQDHFGNTAELSLGKLNFTGWKRLTVAIPATIIQRDFHYKDKMGIKVLGFKIECDPMEAYGSYYIYFDDLRAVTDLFSEESRDPDDMMDVW